jgi:hypothetical protein
MVTILPVSKAPTNSVYISRQCTYTVCMHILHDEDVFDDKDDNSEPQ